MSNFLPQRKTIRLRSFDYATPGAYFVTMVVHNHAPIFGRNDNGIIQLNTFGEFVRDEWIKTPSIRSEIELDEFIVMPDHFHGIVRIIDPVHHIAKYPIIFPTHPKSPSVGAAGWQPAAHSGAFNSSGSPTGDPNGPRRAGTLFSFINGFKASVTARINTFRDTPGVPVWQRNYYEHVIRGEGDMGRIRRYIIENPMKHASKGIRG